MENPDVTRITLELQHYFSEVVTLVDHILGPVVCDYSAWRQNAGRFRQDPLKGPLAENL
jgi:hypothetical protein